MKFKQYLIKEAIIRPNIESILNGLDGIKKNNPYCIINSCDYKYDDTDSLINSINDKFEKLRIKFKKLNKKGANTDKKGNIFVYVSDDFYHLFMNKYDVIRKYIEVVLSHELIHREQLNKINWKSYKLTKHHTKSSYFGDKHEIMAHAKTIIDELVYKYFHIDIVLGFLRKPKSGVTPHFDEYMTHFDKNHKVIKRLYKYMYEYILGK